MHTLRLAGLLTPLVCGPQRTHTHTHTHADLEDHLQSTPVVQEGRLFLFCEVYFHTCERAHLRERGLGIHAVRARDKPRSHIILPPPPLCHPMGNIRKRWRRGYMGSWCIKWRRIFLQGLSAVLYGTFIFISMCVCVFISICVCTQSC